MRRWDLGGTRLFEDRPEPGVAAAAADLASLGRGERAGDDGPEHPGEADHVVATYHLEEARLLDDRHLRAAGEEHPAGAPPEPVIDEVGAERPEVLGPRDRLERESAPTRCLALPTGTLNGGGDHSGGRYR